MRVSVPEVAVDEYSNLTSREDKIRASGELRAPSPSRDPVPSHQAKETQLGGVVPLAANSRHDSRTLLGFEAVCHTLTLATFFFWFWFSFSSMRTSSSPSSLMMSVCVRQSSRQTPPYRLRNLASLRTRSRGAGPPFNATTHSAVVRVRALLKLPVLAPQIPRCERCHDRHRATLAPGGGPHLRVVRRTRVAPSSRTLRGWVRRYRHLSVCNANQFGSTFQCLACSAKPSPRPFP